MRRGWVWGTGAVGALVLAACAREVVVASRPPAEVRAPSRAEPAVQAVAVPPQRFVWQRGYVGTDGAGQFAIVRLGAEVRAVARADAPAWRLDGPKELLVKVVGREGAFVTVEFDWARSPAQLHCHGWNFGLGLRVFVREEHLVDVTTAAASVEIAEGTGINVAPGVRVYGGSMVTLYMDDLAVVVERERVAVIVGKIYTAAHRDSVPEPLNLSSRGVLRYGPREVGYATGPGTYVYAVSAADPDHLLVGTECLQVAGWRREPPENGGGSGGGGCGGVAGDPWLVKAGTELRWPDGRPAGYAYKDHVVFDRTRTRGKLRCFSPAPGGCSHAAALRVCAARDAVIPTEDPLEGWLKRMKHLAPAPTVTRP